jgi:hypothetical protein
VKRRLSQKASNVEKRRQRRVTKLIADWALEDAKEERARLMRDMVKHRIPIPVELVT